MQPVIPSSEAQEKHQKRPARFSPVVPALCSRYAADGQEALVKQPQDHGCLSPPGSCSVRVSDSSRPCFSPLQTVNSAGKESRPHPL